MTRNLRNTARNLAIVLWASPTIAAGLMFAAPAALAQSGEYPYGEGRPFGLGLVVGDPTGISAEKWLGHRTAFDVGAAWSLDDGDTVELTGDHVWYDFGILETRRHTLAVHYGLGGRVLFSDPHDDRAGIRMPVGMTYFAADGRVGIFAQVAPLLDLAPDTDVGVQGGVGVRYFLR